MAKFRKKPVVIEAVQFTKEMALAYVKELGTLPNGVIFGHSEWNPSFGLVRFGCHINTLEGRMEVNFGDWIITGVKGEVYPCKPDIFEMTYEPA